jgi:uncharacterized circularly permuted ATP-grasp superfamily protein/uncharacterized alpha-E superfamily protein
MGNVSSKAGVSLPATWTYTPAPGYFDEMVGERAALRKHWGPLLDSLARLTREDFTRRWQEGRRIVRDNGITYNVYGDPQSTDRPWPLNPIPQMLAPDEWAEIETAIIQRANLFNAILADVYGPQRLLETGLLPPELIFGNPQFLRPCHGVTIPQNSYLHIYAADLARSPDGRWWVIADRTQAPSGAGYALENRIVSTRILPDVFAECHVRRLASFFQTLRDSLMAMAPGHRDNPRIVLLTPGPYNETYFEHAFLARYLGYSLVEGGDLAVRDNRVYLKTLGGLLPVDVVMRRQDDSYCDPLEFRNDSILGVPGLMQAVRSGAVTVANALGSGVMESPAISAFLPGLCRYLFGEELRMPPAATWWCGESYALRYVVEHLGRLVVKPAFPGPGQDPVFCSRLSEEERQKLAQRIRKQPHKYVAQEQVALSTTPVWTDDGTLSPRHLVLRVYAVAADGSYVVMPGGLSRTSSEVGSMIVSVQRGGGSIDTWVRAERPMPPLSLLRQATQPIDISRATIDLPSRVADNLFWLGRYAERIESGVRLARAVLPGVQDSADGYLDNSVRIGIRILTDMEYLPPDMEKASADTSELTSLLFDVERRGSLGWHADQLRRVAWLLRDRLSNDTWRVLNRLDAEFKTPQLPEPLRMGGAIDQLNQAILTLSAFSGLVMESMTRGQGWRVLDIGRRMERGLQMVELLKHTIVTAAEPESQRLETLLEIADSSMTYRSRYLTSLRTNLVIDLLLIDDANPRSLAFQLDRLSEHIDQLPLTSSSARLRPEARLILDARSAVRLSDLDALAKPAGSGMREELDRLLDKVGDDLRALSETLTRSYMTHATPSRPLSRFQEGPAA